MLRAEDVYCARPKATSGYLSRYILSGSVERSAEPSWKKVNVNKYLKQLPQIDALLKTEPIAELVSRFSHAETVDALRKTLSGLRDELLCGDRKDLPDFTSDEFGEAIETVIRKGRLPLLKPVINATGIVIHTNLGRAPLAHEAIAAMKDIAAAPSNLEYNLENGGRGNRMSSVEALLCDLTGAEAAHVVNNCAAAVMLGLMGTAMGRKVVVSRGELVEIGGSFRLPDIIQQSGAILREVGTTNKTRAGDYAEAIESDTAVLLKSHTSNFQIIGFTSAPARSELAKLSRQYDVLLVEDLGSGVLRDLSVIGLGSEPVVRDVLSAGVDLVMFSGDKLLGGPQAGILAGRADVIETLRRHPFARAIRIDKLSLAALEATLRLYREPNDPFRQIPVLRMLSEPVESLRQRASTLTAKLSRETDLICRTIDTTAQAGGGALPGQSIASAGVALRSRRHSSEELAKELRTMQRPVIGRIRDNEVILDLRTVQSSELDLIVSQAAMRDT